MVRNVGEWIAYRLRLCAAKSEECCQQSGGLVRKCITYLSSPMFQYSPCKE